jgi:DNA-binding NtrC family response regulator
MKEKPEKSILFICFDHTLCESVALFLSAWFPSSCARNFSDAEAHVRKQGASLLLIDVPLSEETVKRIKRMKKAHPRIPIIFMSVYHRATAHLEQELRPLVDVWFYKPFDLEELRKSVESLMSPTK